jgi:hypothetical protein
MYLGCADSDIVTSDIDSSIAPASAGSKFSRVDKPIAGVPPSRDPLWGGFSTGKPNDVQHETIESVHSLIDQILPDPQMSPVIQSGE